MSDIKNLYNDLVNFYNVNDENFKEFMAKLYEEMLANHRDVKYVKEHLKEEIVKKLDEYLTNGKFNINIQQKVEEFLNNSDVISDINTNINDINSQLEQNTNYLNNIGFNFIQQGGVKGEYGNNRQVLQTLIKTLNTMGGGTIFIPEGTYYFERPSNNASYCIKVLSNVSIRGAGRGRTILKCGRNEDTSLYSLFWNCDQGITKTNMKFEDFTVDMSDMGNENTPYGHKGKAFYIQGNTNSVYRDLELIGTPSTALGIDFLNNVIIDNVDCDTCGRLWVLDYTNSQGQKIEGPGGAGIGIGTGLLPI